jgi:hypothetical protein
VSDSNLEIYLGDGKGAFARSYQSAEAEAGELAPPADFNGDGKLDVAWIASGVPTMRTGDGAGGLGATAWTPADNAPGSALRMTADDFNGDGHADLAVAYFGTGNAGGVRTFLGQANGTLSDGLGYAYPDASATRPNVVDWGDVNHDGHDDLLLGTNNQGLMLAMGQANGAFAHPAGTDSGNVLALYTDDFDGDGFVDGVVYAKGTALLLRSGSNDCPRTLAVGAVCSPTARFSPVAPIGYDGALLLASNDPDGLLGVDLLGRGVPRPLTNTAPSAAARPAVSAPVTPSTRSLVTAAAGAVGRALSGSGSRAWPPWARPRSRSRRPRPARRPSRSRRPPAACARPRRR